MYRMPRLAPVLILVAVGVAGCGGSGPATNRQTFVAQADPICKQVSVERTTANAAVSKASPSKTKELAVLARVAPGVASDERQAVVRLRTLTPPSSLSSDWHVLLTGMQQLASDATQVAADAKANEFKDAETVTSSGRHLREQLTAIAARDGFTYCGRTS
jgi:hypothetical protein